MEILLSPLLKNENSKESNVVINALYYFLIIDLKKPLVKYLGY